MKNLLKALFCATLLCVLALGFMATEVQATEEIAIVVVPYYGQEPLAGVEFGLYHNNQRVDSEVSVMFLGSFFFSYFTTADFDNLEVRLLNTSEFTSQRLTVPLRDFEQIVDGFFEFIWQVTPVSGNVVDPPTEVNDPPPAASRVLRFAIGITTYTDNGTNRTLEAAPFIQNDRTMVPLRVIGEALGATNLAHNAGVITFNINGQAFTMTVGEPLPGNMGTPVIVAGRTFVPLAFIINEMGATARWDGSARAAYIYID